MKEESRGRLQEQTWLEVREHRMRGCTRVNKAGNEPQRQKLT